MPLQRFLHGELVAPQVAGDSAVAFYIKQFGQVVGEINGDFSAGDDRRYRNIFQRAEQAFFPLENFVEVFSHQIIDEVLGQVGGGNDSDAANTLGIEEWRVQLSGGERVNNKNCFQCRELLNQWWLQARLPGS